MAFPIGAALAAGGSLLGGIFGSKGAKDAAQSQERAAQSATEEQRRQFDVTQQNFAPMLESGQRADAALAYELGLGPRPQRQGWEGVPGVERIRQGQQQQPRNALAGIQDPFARARAEEMASARGQAPPQATGGGGPRFRVGDRTFGSRREARDYRRELFDDRDPADSFNYGGFRETPGYDFRFNEGLDAMQATAAAGGMAGSGAALKAATQYGQNVASEEYGNYMNRLAALSGRGQTMSNSLAGFGAQTAGNVGNLLMAGGDARAQGAFNQANVIGGTLEQLGGIAGRYFGGQATPPFGARTSDPFGTGTAY